MPLVSIVIPLYNKAKHIRATLESVLNQTFPDFEIVIVNDGSTDSSEDEVAAVKDDRIRLFTITNSGVSFARNYGISKANAQWIAFLDADDYWFPHHLEDLVNLKNDFPGCGLYCKAYYKEMKGVKIPSLYAAIPQTPWRGIVADYFASSVVNALAWTSAVMISKTVLQEMGGFDEKITLGAGEDTDLWMRIALKHRVAFDNNTSAIHKLHADNRISNSNTHLRNFIDLDRYDVLAKNNPSLHKYLDVNRFSIGMQYKLAGNVTKARDYFSKISLQNLNKKQRFLLKQPAFVLRLFHGFKALLLKFGMNVSAFR